MRKVLYFYGSGDEGKNGNDDITTDFQIPFIMNFHENYQHSLVRILSTRGILRVDMMMFQR